MFTANLGCMLAKRGHKVCLVDMDLGMRNLDLYLGLEDKVVYDVMDVLQGVCRIKQALIKDKSFPGLYFMAASPKPEDGEITPLHMKVLVEKLSSFFDYVLIDCPAGLDDGLVVSTCGSDCMILMLTSDYASLRDSEIIYSNLERLGVKDVRFVINKVDPELVNSGLELGAKDYPEIVKKNAIGIIRDDKNIRISTNVGMPIVYKEDTYIFENFKNIAVRIETMFRD